MKDYTKITIEAVKYYRVMYLDDSRSFCTIYDGQCPVFNASLKPYSDFVDEVVLGGNECAVYCETFKTRLGNLFVYWRDDEIGAHYVSKVVK